MVIPFEKSDARSWLKGREAQSILHEIRVVRHNKNHAKSLGSITCLLEFNYFAVAVSVVQLGHGGLIFCALHSHTLTPRLATPQRPPLPVGNHVPKIAKLCCNFHSHLLC